VPSIVTFSLVNATYTNIAMNIAFARDLGVLKRVRGTPIPAISFLAGKVMHSALVMILLVVITTAAGAIFYDVEVPDNTLPAVLLALMVGAASFCALGLAITPAIPNADAAPAVVNATILPLYFVSDVFIRIEDPPRWLELIQTITPVKHLQEAFFTAYNPFVQGAGVEWGDLAVVGAWGVAGLLLAARFFSWEPRR
jgi:ABC-2 type transport system permease protein